MGRRSNREGTLFKRKDGRWSAQVYVTLPNGTSKRVCITNRDREIVRVKLREALNQEHRKIPYVEREWTIGDYLDYWLNVVQKNRICETTKTIYSQVIKNHIKPNMCNLSLKNLTVQDVRTALAVAEKQGCKPRTLQIFRQILSACLNCAMREELIFRNVAQLVEKPKYTPKDTAIWSPAQAEHFLQVAEEHPYYIIFLFLLTYGMRRGEAIGVRWCDIDFENGVIHLRQQIGRIGSKMVARELKTKNSLRPLPLGVRVRGALLAYAKKNSINIPPYDPYAAFSTQGTVVVSNAGTPVEPRNLVRCYNELVEKAWLPRIKIHAMRHTAATMLKDLDVQLRDVQLLLGHADISTTSNIYQHGTFATQRSAIDAVESTLLGRTAMPAAA